MEAELNENCPSQLYPAIGIRAHGSGTVSVCVMDPSNWNTLDEHAAGKHAQVSDAIYRSLQQWKHISNQSRIDKVIAMVMVADHTY